MKIWGPFFLFCGIVAASAADEPFVSSPVKDIVKLSQAGMSAPVIESYVNNSPVAYSPSVDEILYMKKQGVPDEVVAGMLRHGTDLRSQPSVAGQVPMPATPAPGVPVVNGPAAQVAPTPATAPVVDYASPYAYPDYYPYAYDWWPYWGINVGWGWGYWGGGYWPYWHHGHYPWHGGHGGWGGHPAPVYAGRPGWGARPGYGFHGGYMRGGGSRGGFGHGGFSHGGHGR